jgi:hypothetical protein
MCEKQGASSSRVAPALCDQTADKRFHWLLSFDPELRGNWPLRANNLSQFVIARFMVELKPHACRMIHQSFLSLAAQPASISALERSPGAGSRSDRSHSLR